jgi:hypothetical protein
MWVDELTPDQIMDRAADIIDENGWCRNKLINNMGEVCTLGAMQIATIGRLTSVIYDPMLNAAIDFIEANFVLTAWIADWNDNICTDRYQAADMLRTEAKRYREYTSRV